MQWAVRTPALRWRALVMLAALLSSLSVAVAADPAQAAAPPDPDPLAHSSPAAPAEERSRGLVYDGMQRTDDSHPCRGAFELRHPDRDPRSDGPLGPVAAACTHGPDPAPEGLDVRVRRELPKSELGPGVAAAPPGVVQCYGDGANGARVQLIYARASGVADRYTQVAPTFQQVAAQVDDVFNASAAETGGARYVRWVTDAGCRPVVANVVLSNSGDDNIQNTISELSGKGYNRTDRKYLVWVDANVYCGIAQIYSDDRPGQENYNNGNPAASGMVARVDNGCWGLAGQSVEAHELMHNLGGVQSTAPRGTNNSHCTDDRDRMCYNDGSGEPVVVVCADVAHENRFDCNHDDYYSTAPPAGSWLATHWNSANSVFLATAAAPSPTGPVTEESVYRPSTGVWYVQNRTPAAYGTSGDIPVAADYNGNGTDDVAVFRPANSTWYVQGSAPVVFGTSGDIPVPGDYDGNGTDDMAVFRPSTGAWHVRGVSSVTYGTSGDIPVPADYNGNGTDDVAVYRPSTGSWFIQGASPVGFGGAGDIPVPGDYSGNGSADVAVFRPATGVWYVQGGSASAYGTSGDIPVPGDYNGNGITDVAVFRPSTGVWFAQGSPAVALGAPGDIPLPLPGAIRRFFFPDT